MYFKFAASRSVLGLRGFSMLWQGVEALHCLILLHCVTTLYLDAFHCEENGSLPNWGYQELGYNGYSPTCLFFFGDLKQSIPLG